MAELTPEAEATLFIVRAMLGEAVPELRYVVGRCGPGVVSARFGYAPDFADDIDEMVSDMEGEVMGDYAPEVRVTFEAERFSTGELSLADGEFLIYLQGGYTVR